MLACLPGQFISSATRFTKMNLCSLSTINLSAHNLSKPKLHLRHCLVASSSVQLGFREVTYTQICGAQTAQVHFSKPSRSLHFTPRFNRCTGCCLDANAGYCFNQNAGSLQKFKQKVAKFCKVPQSTRIDVGIYDIQSSVNTIRGNRQFLAAI